MKVMQHNDTVILSNETGTIYLSLEDLKYFISSNKFCYPFFLREARRKASKAKTIINKIKNLEDQLKEV